VGDALVTFSNIGGRRRTRTLAQQSPKRQAQEAAWEECKRVVRERARGRCEGVESWPHECRGGIEVHHVKTRARYPGSLTDPEACMALCERAHHELVGRFPAEAQERGLLAPSGPVRRLLINMDESEVGA